MVCVGTALLRLTPGQHQAPFLRGAASQPSRHCGVPPYQTPLRRCMTTIREVAKRRQARRLSRKPRRKTYANLSFGALAARLATHLHFPPSPPAEDWDAPSVQLSLKPVNFDDDDAVTGQQDAPYLADAYPAAAPSWWLLATARRQGEDVRRSCPAMRTYRERRVGHIYWCVGPLEWKYVRGRLLKHALKRRRGLRPRDQPPPASYTQLLAVCVIGDRFDGGASGSLP